MLLCSDVELRNHERHWPPVLDAFGVARFLFVERRLQRSGAWLSMSSVPIVFGGLLLLKGNNFALACFNGSNFRVHNWLVFSLDEPNVEFISEANRNCMRIHIHFCFCLYSYCLYENTVRVCTVDYY